MNPRRPRAGIRRDGGVRKITTDEVRYPGHDIPVTTEAADGLGQMRDTGIAVESRRARELRRRGKQRAVWTWVGFGVFVVVALAGFAWQHASDVKAARQPLESAATSATPDAAHASPGTDPAVPKAVAVTPITPVFATYQDVKLHLPVQVTALTEVGFHQASYPYAHKLKTPLPDADIDKAKEDKSTGRDASQQATGADAVLVGSVLRMWRNRPGKPDTAVDVGADPGSDVYAPVTGTVVKAVPFKLYDRYKDYEIHIQPLGRPDLDLVLIHISDPSVSVGDKVVAGQTRIAAVRKIAKSIRPQLRQYTPNDGYHTHIQLNDADYKGYRKKSLKGAIQLDAAGNPVAE